jgi:hypothetical protein
VCSSDLTIPALTVISWPALQYYGQSLVHEPDYWGEIRFPSVLAKSGMQVIANPYVANRYFFSPDKSVPEDQRSMKKEVIREAIKGGWKALHPIKDYNLLDFIRSVNEEETITKEPL